MIQFKDGNTAITLARDAEIASLCQSYSIKDNTGNVAVAAAQDGEQSSIISSSSRLSSTSSRSTTLTR